MVKVLFVHGMNHEGLAPAEIEGSWFPSFRRALAQALDQGGRPGLASELELELELLYWGDLFKDLPGDAYPLQGLGDEFEKLFYALVRRVTLRFDRLTKYDPLARPKSFIAKRIHAQVFQTAMYMANAPIRRRDPAALPNVYDEIQARFRARLARNPDIVIGHSLGSVIAYEGLCQHRRRVPVLLTVGSPIGVPDLIYEKLRPPESKPRSAPNVREWVNVSNLADAVVVPVPEIASLFREPIRDVVIQRGKLDARAFVRNHRFVEYLKDERVAGVIADAVESVSAERRR